MTVTVAIPFYNSEAFLEIAIKSVLYQSYKDWKLLLVNDGSTDNSLKIARKYEAEDTRIKVYSDGENKKLPYRLNQISKLADTKYLARMDADDIMHPDRIRKQLEILEQNDTIDVLGTNVFSIDQHNKIRGMRIQIDNEGFKLLDTKSFVHPSIMAKTTWFLNNPYNVKALRAQDIELWHRVAGVSTLKVYTRPLLFYREFNSRYYKKYFTGAKSMFDLARIAKDSSWIFKGGVECLKGSIYYLADKLNIENELLIKRNCLATNEILLEGNEILQEYKSKRSVKSF